jgi:hypothetical protein
MGYCYGPWPQVFWEEEIIMDSIGVPFRASIRKNGAYTLPFSKSYARRPVISYARK